VAVSSDGNGPVPAAYPGERPPRGSALTCEKDGVTWRIGTAADVGWIQSGVEVTRAITSAIPAVFEAYATVLVPDQDRGRARDFALLLDLLRDQSADQPWWLGYLETGADDLVFPQARRTSLYAHWPYVLVEAGPDQAAQWRQDLSSWRAPGPDLIFPADRSWLLSWLWDDDWRCFGGPAELVARLLSEPRLQVRRVPPREDATPPGHISR
jgi:hypothetical protein